MIGVEKSYEHDVQVVSDAIQSARDSGVAIHTISLLRFNLPYYYLWEVPDLSTLSESLRKLLEPIQVLRLDYSNSPLELLFHCVLNLLQLDMCYIVAQYSDLEDFLIGNKRSIRSIRFHDVKIKGLSELESQLPKMSSSMLCRMLNAPQSTQKAAA